MLSAALIIVSLAIGYILVAGLAGLTTYGVAMLRPSLAVRNRRITTSFNLLLHAAWFVFSVLGGYVVATGAAEASPRMAAAMLAVILLFVIWRNLDEVRQRGLVHTLLTSGLVVTGIATGYLLHMRQLPSVIPPQ